MNMDYYLARLPILKRLPARTLEEISFAFVLRSYARREVIFDDGDPPDSVFLLKSGLVKAVKFSPRAEPVIMEVIVPGGLFGMIAVMDRKPYPVGAVCIRESEVYRIRAPYFDGLLKGHPDFAREVYAEIGAHLRHSQALRALAKESAQKRIAYILWMLSGSVGRELPILREDIAEMAGTTTSTAIRTLVGLRRRKLIGSRWKRISVLRPEALRALSEVAEREPAAPAKAAAGSSPEGDRPGRASGVAGAAGAGSSPEGDRLRRASGKTGASETSVVYQI